MKVKNISGSEEVYCGQVIPDQAEYVIQATELAKWRVEDKVLTNIAQGKLSVYDGSQYIATNGTALTYFLDQYTKDVKVTESPPFAAPTFRTKRSKTASIETVVAGETKNIDFLLTSELYAHGGGMVYTGAEIGDYVSAEIRDVNGIIPEPYRAALCENWPTVATYIIGEWVPKGDGRYEINTYPLNAKITPGLYLRITYVACATGSDRKVGVNYYLAKKL